MLKLPDEEVVKMTPMIITLEAAMEIIHRKCIETYSEVVRIKKQNYSSVSRLAWLHFAHSECLLEEVHTADGTIEMFHYKECPTGAKIIPSCREHIAGELPHMSLLRWSKLINWEDIDRDQGDALILYYANWMRLSSDALQAELVARGHCAIEQVGYFIRTMGSKVERPLPEIAT